MFALIQFNDESYYICKEKDLRIKDNKSIVRYKGSRFECTVLAANADKKNLLESKENLESQDKSNDGNELLSENLFDRTSIYNAETEKNKSERTKAEKNTNSDTDIVETRDSGNMATKRDLLDDGSIGNISCESNTNDPEKISVAGKKMPVIGEDYFADEIQKDILSERCKSNDTYSDNFGNSNILLELIELEKENIVILNNEQAGEKENYPRKDSENDLPIRDAQSHQQYLLNPTTDDSQKNSVGDRKKPTIIEERTVKLCNVARENSQSKVWQLNVTNLDNSKNNNSLTGLSSIELLPEEEIDTSLTETATVLMNANKSIWDYFLTPNTLENDNDQTPSPLNPKNTADECYEPTVSDKNIALVPLSQLEVCAKKETTESQDLNDFNGDCLQNKANSNLNESEYIPDPNGSNSTNNESRSSKNDHDNTGQSVNTTINLISSHTTNIVGNSAPDDVTMFVPNVESGTKRDYCIFCNTEQAKLSRHVLRKHKFEEDVAAYLSHPKGSRERKTMMAKIRKRGHYAFNTSQTLNTGERKVVRRPNARYNKNATDFATCPFCFGDYAKSSLRHHVRRCTTRKNKKRRDILVASKQVTGRVHPKASDVFRQRVFPTLLDDEIVRAIRYDELVILFANKLCRQYQKPHQYDMIRNKIRLLGRFLIEIRKHTQNVEDFFSVYYPKNYEVAILAVQSMAGLNEDGTGFDVPSIATSLGTLLKQVGKLCVSECIKRQEKEKKCLRRIFSNYLPKIIRLVLLAQQWKHTPKIKDRKK